MPDYRLYFLNEFGKILRAEVATADTDEEACTAALALDHADAIEIWELRRMVAKVYPKRR